MPRINPDALYAEDSHDPLDPPASGPLITFTVHGSDIHAMLYIPKGPGPHPLTIMLHGLPGGNKSEDIAQALRRVGMAALIFSYRGSWGSGGNWSYRNCYEDARSLCQQMRDPALAARYRLDPERILLLGHSFGGALALLTARDLDVRDLIVLSPSDPARQWQTAAATEEGRLRRMRRLEAICGPLNNACAEQLWQETSENLHTFDIWLAIEQFSRQRVLIVGAQYDTTLPVEQYYERQRDGLTERLPGQVTAHLLPTGHNYNSHRMELTKILVDWLVEQGY